MDAHLSDDGCSGVRPRQRMPFDASLAMGMLVGVKTLLRVWPVCLWTENCNLESGKIRSPKKPFTLSRSLEERINQKSVMFCVGWNLVSSHLASTEKLSS